MVTRSTDRTKKIFVSVLLFAEEIHHGWIDREEGFSQLRNDAKKTYSKRLFDFLSRDRRTWDQIEHDLFPNGASILNYYNRRVDDSYDEEAAIADWRERIERMP